MDDSSKNFRILTHPNGTATLVEVENGQAMHSRIGPALESRLVYAEQARLEERLISSDRPRVLYDVGMGTGANVIATLDRVRAAPGAHGRLQIYSFETKPEGLKVALGNLGAFPILMPWERELTGLHEDGEARFRIGAVEVGWRLLVGDFYSRMKEADPPDTVFFDFYSPTVVPELWSLAGFADLRAKIGDHPARLYTYSAATPVRLHLLAAGFFVGLGAATGIKTETTIAATRFELLDRPLPESWLEKLRTSRSIAELRFAEARARALGNSQWARVRSG
jgi:queuine tRNA-ribosyltransferase